MSKPPSHNVTPSTPSSVLSSLQPPTLPTFISAYSPKNKSTILFEGPGRTKQSFKDECDINVIMSRYQQSGIFTHLNDRAPMFGEVPDLDFDGAMAIVVDARARFAQLPATLRDRFSNDPARLLQFLQDSKNLDEAVKLGLVNAPVEPSTPPTPPPAKQADQ